MIDINQFMEIELRTATIVAAERVPETDRLMRLEVDTGGETRQLVAGIAGSYEADELPGLKIAVVANLQPATIRGVESNGMVLAANTDDGAVLVTFTKDVPNGARVR
ncbi:MAG TPA: methionine--tRNA ligase subunit beta [Acidobacteriota bacterium]|jgi:methionyl-tRNA synthetase|nr:methionine--tRNA ligase subunit beta [Acidobacteriota bacterium]MDP6687010.1 methionine--tRNA ligase subunit beta [Acidobacteriota bacterium]MEE3274064.1 methionine--tRNA ligase subunit beta [Acidobacteriota bacterium]HJO30539.1 methionine--tRNA ligase subunit beta [Acidobacteriota bacterium]|tara:strand:- start:5823 stop:6143 length:321 start_codon:yes stop_codon:yes gene_type:complete